MGSEAFRGWIKLEIPCSAQDSRQMNDILHCHVSKLEPILARYDMRVITRGEIQTVEEQDCEPFYEVNYEVTSHQFSHKLVLAIQEYLKKLGTVHLLPFQRGNLVLHSMDFWSSELTCHLVDIPLSAFCFGNIQGGSFINHWEVSFWDDTHRRIRNRRQNIGATMLDKNGHNQIKVEFEFDKMDFMTVHFKQYEHDFEAMDQNGKRSRQTVTMYYQMTVRRSSIRRIIVDPVVADTHMEEEKEKRKKRQMGRDEIDIVVSNK